MPKTDLSIKEAFYIRRHGIKYKPAVLPDDIQRFEAGQCFDACAMNAAVNPLYRYVEGMARPHEDMKWYLHAWLTDGEFAFDPTWQALPNNIERPLPADYIGIEMETDSVIDFMRKTGYQGVVANRHRSPELARQAIGGEWF